MALIWGSILGFIIWDEIPTVPIIIGAAIVTLTGLYLLRHEAFRRPARHPRPIG
jgi:drug/metabolite transporter (DMT)-like permease